MKKLLFSTLLLAVLCMVNAQAQKILLWSLDVNYDKTAFKEHGPTPDWTPINFNDNKILWVHSTDKISVFTVDEKGNKITSKHHGPFKD